MTGKIAIEQRGTELHVAFPFSLKDDFKSTFRTAKWSAASKTWSVTTRSREKLEAWVSAAGESGALLSAEDFDAIELTDREHEALVERMNRLKFDLDGKLREAEKLSDLRERNAEMLKHIEEIQSRIDAAAAENSAQRIAEKIEAQKIEETVRSIIDLDEVNFAVSKMLKEARAGSTSRGRDAFDEHKEIVSAALEALEEAGITSETLSELAHASYNRSGKDIEKWRKPVVFMPYDAEDE